MNVDRHFELIHSAVVSFRDNLEQLKADYLDAVGIPIPPAIHFSLEVVEADPRMQRGNRIPRYYLVKYRFNFSKKEHPILSLADPDDTDIIKTSTIYIYDSFDTHRYFRDLEFHFWEHVSNHIGNTLLKTVFNNLEERLPELETQYSFDELTSKTFFEHISNILLENINNFYPQKLLEVAKIEDIVIIPNEYNFKSIAKEDSEVFQFDANYEVSAYYNGERIVDVVGLTTDKDKQSLLTKKALIFKIANICFWLIVKDCYWNSLVIPDILKANYVERDVLLS